MPASQIEVARSARQHLPVVDYADAFLIPTDDRFPAEAWAREAFEHVEVRHLIVMQAIWRVLLGLRLGALGARGQVAGWQILEQHEDVVVLAATSRMMDARLVFEAGQEGATMTTLLHFRGRLGRWVWSAAGGIHRRGVPRILARSRAGLRRDADDPDVGA
jgi:Protein of unknown function (DUF2867)